MKPKTLHKSDTVHRLEDLLVEEVSIVDRPANKRRFLFVKTEDGMAKLVTQDENGELVTAKSEQTAAAPATAPATATAPSPVEKRLTITSELRSEIFRSLGDSIRRIHTVLGAAEIAEVNEKEESTLVPVMMGELKEISTSIGSTVKRLNAVAKSEDADAVPPSDTVRDALQVAVDAVEEVVSKRDIGKGRLTKFKQALGTLQTILSELEGPSKAPNQAVGTDEPTKQAAAAAAAKTTSVAKSSDVDDGVVRRLGGYVESLVKTVEEQGKVIQQLRKSRPLSNAIAVDGSADKPHVEPSWPLDMNVDRSPGKVEKSISFYD